eukprot:Clim_evm29s108 gene=Clim_evmTU29s108
MASLSQNSLVTRLARHGARQWLAAASAQNFQKRVTQTLSSGALYDRCHSTHPLVQKLWERVHPESGNHTATTEKLLESSLTEFSREFSMKRFGGRDLVALTGLTVIAGNHSPALVELRRNLLEQYLPKYLHESSHRESIIPDRKQLSVVELGELACLLGGPGSGGWQARLPVSIGGPLAAAITRAIGRQGWSNDALICPSSPSLMISSLGTSAQYRRMHEGRGIARGLIGLISSLREVRPADREQLQQHQYCENVRVWTDILFPTHEPSVTTAEWQMATRSVPYAIDQLVQALRQNCGQFLNALPTADLVMLLVTAGMNLPVHSGVEFQQAQQQPPTQSAGTLLSVAEQKQKKLVQAMTVSMQGLIGDIADELLDRRQDFQTDVSLTQWSQLLYVFARFQTVPALESRDGVRELSWTAAQTVLSSAVATSAATGRAMHEYLTPLAWGRLLWSLGYVQAPSVTPASSSVNVSGSRNRRLLTPVIAQIVGKDLPRHLSAMTSVQLKGVLWSLRRHSVSIPRDLRPAVLARLRELHACSEVATADLPPLLRMVDQGRPSLLDRDSTPSDLIPLVHRMFTTVEADEVSDLDNAADGDDSVDMAELEGALIENPRLFDSKRWLWYDVPKATNDGGIVDDSLSAPQQPQHTTALPSQLLFNRESHLSLLAMAAPSSTVSDDIAPTSSASAKPSTADLQSPRPGAENTDSTISLSNGLIFDKESQ